MSFRSFRSQLSEQQIWRLEAIGRRLAKEINTEPINSFVIISEMLDTIFTGYAAPSPYRVRADENGAERKSPFIEGIAQICAKVGADPKIVRMVLVMICSGVREPHDFEIVMNTHQGLLRKAAKAVVKYERAYWLINVLKDCELVASAEVSRCQKVLRNAIRRDAPAQLTEIALLKVASDGKLLDVETVCTRIMSWQRSLYLNANAKRPPAKPLVWEYFSELNVLPNDLREESVEEIISGVEPEALLLTRKLSWTILPRGRHPYPELVKHFEALQETEGGPLIDENRLKRICELELTDTYSGMDDFKGYIVFDYSRYGFAILECPFVGNAIYILLGDWESLSRLSKGELLDSHARNTMRITHKGDWFDRLNDAVCILREDKMTGAKDLDFAVKQARQILNEADGESDLTTQRFTRRRDEN
jgi:hypothetical protein